MVSPINYILDVKNPIEEAMRSYYGGREEIQGREKMELARAREDRAAAQEARAIKTFDQAFEQQRLANERQNQMIADFTALAENPMAKAEDYAKLMAKYPNMAAGLKSTWDMVEENYKAPMLTQYGQVFYALREGSTDIAKKLLQEKSEASKNIQNPLVNQIGVTDEALIAQIDADPKKAQVMIGGILSTLGGPAYKSLLDGTNANVQSSQTIGGIASVQTLRDGSTRVKDIRTNKVVTGVEAEKLIAEAYDKEIGVTGSKSAAKTGGRLETEINLGGKAAAVKKEGEEAGKRGAEILNKLDVVETNIANLNRALELVVNENANTGVLAEQIPNFSAAAVELKNIRNALGLDVIGSVTFGALSEGELNLALSTALPTGLDQPELADWIRRKINAQKKFRDNLNTQAEFLDKYPSTLAFVRWTRSGEPDMEKWLRENYSEAFPSETQKPQQSSTQQPKTEKTSVGTDFLSTLSPKDRAEYLRIVAKHKKKEPITSDEGNFMLRMQDLLKKYQEKQGTE